MLQNKDISKTQEIKIFFKDSWVQPDFFSKQLELFNFKKSSKILSAIKTSGVPVWDILKLLFILPFTVANTINSLYNTKFTTGIKGQKDVYYRLLANQKINWRNILLLFVKQYLQLDTKFSESINSPKCLIFDDTEILKTGKKIEGVSKIHSHVKQRFIFGFKLFVAGYWNGSVFIPVDFSFHRENKNNKTKKYGLSKKEIKNQKKTSRAKGSYVLKRFKELNLKKNDILIAMFKRVNQRKIEVEYILIDSWFTTTSLITKLLKINNNINVIGMYKYNSKVFIDEKYKTIKELRKSKKGMKRSRSTRLYYMSFVGEIDGHKYKIFLTRKGKNGAWRTILTTNTNLSFSKMIKIYNIRWTIEVFFKETKQLLGIGKSQSTNFDVLIAQTTITMIQYLLMSIKYRVEAYETIGGLFKDLKQDFIEFKLNERIMSVMLELITVLEFLGINFDLNEIVSKLIDCSDSLHFIKYNKKISNTFKMAG